MDNIIGGRSAVIQVTFLMEDRGFCKDVFATVEKPTRYYNRIFENYTGEVATWYSADRPPMMLSIFVSFLSMARCLTSF